MRIRCPTVTHTDKNPSATLSRTRWRCFACGASGRYNPRKQGAAKWGLKAAKSDEEIFVKPLPRVSTPTETVQPWAWRFWEDFLAARGTMHPLFTKKKIPAPHVEAAIQYGLVRIGRLGIYFVYKHIRENEIVPPVFPLVQVRPFKGEHKYLFIGKYPPNPVFTRSAKVRVLVESPFHVVKVDPHGELGVAACGGVSAMARLQPVVGGVTVIDKEEDVPASLRTGAPFVIGDIDKMEVRNARLFVRSALRMG